MDFAEALILGACEFFGFCETQQTQRVGWIRSKTVIHRQTVEWRITLALIRPAACAPVGDLFDHVQQIQPGRDRAIVARGGRVGAINGKGEIAVALKFDGLAYYRDGWAPYRLAIRDARTAATSASREADGRS